MQDVTRLLYLLNKKPQNVQMPPDGMQLLNWSEEILKRYLQSQVSNKLSCTYMCRFFDVCTLMSYHSKEQTMPELALMGYKLKHTFSSLIS